MQDASTYRSFPVRTDRETFDNLERSYYHETRLNRWNKKYIPDKAFALNSDMDTMLVVGGPEVVTFSYRGRRKERQVRLIYLVKEKDGKVYIQFHLK